MIRGTVEPLDKNPFWGSNSGFAVSLLQETPLNGQELGMLSRQKLSIYFFWVGKSSIAKDIYIQIQNRLSMDLPQFIAWFFSWGSSFHMFYRQILGKTYSISPTPMWVFNLISPITGDVYEAQTPLQKSTTSHWMVRFMESHPRRPNWLRNPIKTTKKDG